MKRPHFDNAVTPMEPKTVIDIFGETGQPIVVTSLETDETRRRRRELARARWWASGWTQRSIKLLSDSGLLDSMEQRRLVRATKRLIAATKS